MNHLYAPIVAAPPIATTREAQSNADLRLHEWAIVGRRRIAPAQWGAWQMNGEYAEKGEQRQLMRDEAAGLVTLVTGRVGHEWVLYAKLAMRPPTDGYKRGRRGRTNARQGWVSA